MDATRSASLFAERMILVEGVSDAVILRQLGAAWSSGNATKEGFIDALTITVVGSKIGRWPVDLLASPGHEIVDRLAVFTDTDTRPGPPADPPAWMNQPPIVRSFRCHPTLEPELVPGNEASVMEALDAMSISHPGPIDAESIDALFQGKAKKRKAEFSLELAAAYSQRSARGGEITVPAVIDEMFTYLFEDTPIDSVAVVALAGTGDEPQAD